ncbi:glycosyltransferase [Prescottella defluvii]|uniref:glycosyltransferase n=1 Tax=Prescottella defluvii TaxID=1323361 RepID=UPI0009DFF423
MTSADGRSLRVLHVAQPTTAGVAAVVAQYVSSLMDSSRESRRRFTVAVACPTDGHLHTDIVTAGAEHLPWSANRSPGVGVLGESRDLARTVRRWRPDVIHLHSAKAGLAGRLAVRERIPTVYQPHAWSFQAARGVTAAAAVRWERAANRWTTLTVNVGGHERRVGEVQGIAGPFHLVSNRVDVAEWGPDDRGEARRLLDMPTDVAVAVCVARLCEQKGQDRLVAIWDRVRAAVPGALLYLVGPDQGDSNLPRPLPEGVVHVGAAVPRRWYAAADAVVMASRWEGLPMVALEAEAAGRVVVATEEAGASGFLDPVDEVAGTDLDALASRVIHRLADRGESARVGELARLRAEKRPGLRLLSVELGELYDRAMRPEYSPGIWESRRHTDPPLQNPLSG